MTTIFKDASSEKHEEWFDKDEIERRKYLDVDVSMHGKICYFLYTTMIIEQDGSIPPCCFSTNIKDDFLRWDNDKTISEMYNSELYLKAREMFKTKKPVDGLACSDCSVFLTYGERFKK